jgi:hypothetical protein
MDSVNHAQSLIRHLNDERAAKIATFNGQAGNPNGNVKTSVSTAGEIVAIERALKLTADWIEANS